MKLRIVELKNGAYALEYHSPFYGGKPEGKWIRINKKLQEDEFASYPTKSEIIDFLESLQESNVVFETEIEGIEVKKRGPYFGSLEGNVDGQVIKYNENTYIMPCANNDKEHNNYLEIQRQALDLAQRGHNGILF